MSSGVFFRRLSSMEPRDYRVVFVTQKKSAVDDSVLFYFFENTFLNVTNENIRSETKAPAPQILITVSGMLTPNAIPLSITIKNPASRIPLTLHNTLIFLICS